MLILPRIEPDNVGEFTDFWDRTMEKIEEWANGGGGLDLNALFGAGRFVEADITEGAMEISGDLTVVLPAHSKGYLIQGNITPFPSDLDIDGIPLNKPKAEDGSGGSYGFLEFTDDTQTELMVVWYSDGTIPDPSPVSEGKPCIGRAFTNTIGGIDIIEEIETVSADYIQNPVYNRQLISSLVGRITLLEGLITGGGSLSGANIPIVDGSAQSIKTYMDAKDTALQNALDLITGGRDILPMLLPNDEQVNTIGRMAVGLGERNPHALDRLPMAVILNKLHGDGTAGSPNYVGPGTINISEDGRTFEP